MFKCLYQLFEAGCTEALSVFFAFILDNFLMYKNLLACPKSSMVGTSPSSIPGGSGLNFSGIVSVFLMLAPPSHLLRNSVKTSGTLHDREKILTTWSLAKVC